MLVGSSLIQTAGGSSGQTINATILCQLSMMPIKSDYNCVANSSVVQEGRPIQPVSLIGAKPYRGQRVTDPKRRRDGPLVRSAIAKSDRID
jgi:hypothetical protein